MLENAGWHRVTNKFGWTLWAHGGLKGSYDFKGAAKIHKERMATRRTIEAIMQAKAAEAEKRLLGEG